MTRLRSFILPLLLLVLLAGGHSVSWLPGRSELWAQDQDAAEAMKCPKCQRGYKDGAYCPVDGVKLLDMTRPRTCLQCQSQYRGQELHCPKDGTPLIDSREAEAYLKELRRRSGGGAVGPGTQRGRSNPLRVAFFIGLFLVMGYFIAPWLGFGGMLRSGPLCDSCAYNDQRYCSRPERPNAEQCSEFKSRFNV